MAAVGEHVTAASRVRFVPFTVLHRAGKVLVSRADRSDWLELDTVGERVLIDLDDGYRVGEVRDRLQTDLGERVDIGNFLEELAGFGFIAGVDGEHASSRVAEAAAPERPSWPWTCVLAATAVLAAYSSWTLATDRVALPTGADLLLPGLSLGLAIPIAILTGIGLVTLHEVGHVLAGRYYGLSPRLGFGRRGVWLVAEADLTGVHALDRSLQWRPIAAGPMVDLVILGLSVAALSIAGPDAAIAPVVRLLSAVAIAQLLWQLQWYLRTDIYFMFVVTSGATTLRRTAWSWAVRGLGVRPAPAHMAVSRRERVTARLYLMSLPVALFATYLLGSWVLVPFARELAA